jgi:hypothetical protein
MRVSVPFALMAGKTNLPAGDYTVSEEMTHVDTLKGTHGSAVLLASPGRNATKQGSAWNIGSAVHGWGQPSSTIRQ